MGKKDKGGSYGDWMDAIADSIKSAKDADDFVFRGNAPKYNPHPDEEMEMLKTTDEIEREKAAVEDKLGIKPRGMKPADIEESLHFTRVAGERRFHKYTDEEMEEIRNGCLTVYVHDYGEHDYYHMSEEDRDRLDPLAPIRHKLGGLRRVYRQVDQYVKAMRIVYEAWGMLAEGNPLHTREEFFELVGKGKIVSQRLVTPKLKGFDKYNADVIMQYISDTELDPEDLIPNENTLEDQYYRSSYDPEEAMSIMLDPDELNHIIAYEGGFAEPSTIYSETLSRKLLRRYDDSLNSKWAINLTSKKKKKKKKKDKTREHIQEITSGMLKKIQAESYQKTYTYTFGLTENFFAVDNRPTILDGPLFEGSWANDDHVRLLGIATNEDHMAEAVPGVSYLTNNDQHLQQFFKSMENHGVNTLDLRRRIGNDPDDYVKKHQEATKKDNKKLETRIVDRIKKLSEDPKFAKLVKKSEKALEKYNKEEAE